MSLDSYDIIWRVTIWLKSSVKAYLCQWAFSVCESVRDIVYEPVPLSEVGTHRVAQVVVGPNVSQHGHQTCRQTATTVPHLNSCYRG